MNSEELKINETTPEVNLNIDTQELNKIIEIIKLAFNELQINTEGMQIYYQRKKDSTSVLAIQIEHGDNKDMKNYMLNGCQSWRHKDKVSCDIYMHANKKVAQKAMKMANLVSESIVNFFESFEQTLLKNNNFDISLSITIPLNEIKKEKSINRLIRKIIKK